LRIREYNNKTFEHNLLKPNRGLRHARAMVGHVGQTKKISAIETARLGTLGDTSVGNVLWQHSFRLA
jgi:hypothetical protein